MNDMKDMRCYGEIWFSQQKSGPFSTKNGPVNGKNGPVKTHIHTLFAAGKTDL